MLLSRVEPYAIGWQIEHNGPWAYELGETRRGAYLLLSGPTDQEHQWSAPITAGHGFRSVPASVAVAEGGLDEVMAVLTDQRRALRKLRAVDATLPVVFNDYMNTLMGDPTTEKLLPLIDAAADAGADCFCIDAGWYAEGHWWDAVGAWQPAESRFPGGGLAAVLDRIRSRGMVAGLWLEPEVIGVRSPLATTLPDGAFFSRGGVRIAEHGRHLLDLRHPAAVAHVDEVIDRLAGDYGVGFIKMDYNTMTGPGTDSTGTARGPRPAGTQPRAAGMDRPDPGQAPGADHRELRLRCDADGLRDDVAAAPAVDLRPAGPGRVRGHRRGGSRVTVAGTGGNWAYPVAGQEPELLTLSLVNGIVGRMYLSGYLNRMSDIERAAVREAIAAHRTVLSTMDRSHPFWPLGLPGWTDGWVVLGLAAAPMQ